MGRLVQQAACNHQSIFSSADKVISRADGITDLAVIVVICPSSISPPVNFHFKSLLLLQFLYIHSEFFTRETKHIVPPCNKARISNFQFEFQISLKCYSSFSSYLNILIFYTGETRYIGPPCNKEEISNRIPDQ